jgi:hypothetical protein
MKRLLFIFCSVLLVTCSSDDSAPKPELREFEITYEVISTNNANAFRVTYFHGNQENLFNSGPIEVSMQENWSQTLNLSTRSNLNLALWVLSGNGYSTTLSIYVDNVLVETETFTGDESVQLELRHFIE